MNKVYNNNNILSVQLSECDNVFSILILNPCKYYMSVLAMCYQSGK